LHTNWCPQTNQPNTPQQLPEEQERRGSGTSNQSVKHKTKTQSISGKHQKGRKYEQFELLKI